MEPLLARAAHRGALRAAEVVNFCWCIANAQIREGGFDVIHGDPGTGKSVALRLLAERLSRLPDVTVGAINHPQSNLADLYREIGDIFTVPLRPHNRWGGFKALRERWLAHLEGARRRAVLLVDEAQEMNPAALCELRLLAGARFDCSHCCAWCSPATRASSTNCAVGEFRGKHTDEDGQGIARFIARAPRVNTQSVDHPSFGPPIKIGVKGADLSNLAMPAMPAMPALREGVAATGGIEVDPS